VLAILAFIGFGALFFVVFIRFWEGTSRRVERSCLPLARIRSKQWRIRSKQWLDGRRPDLLLQTCLTIIISNSVVCLCLAPIIPLSTIVSVIVIVLFAFGLGFTIIAVGTFVIVVWHWTQRRPLSRINLPRRCLKCLRYLTCINACLRCRYYLVCAKRRPLLEKCIPGRVCEVEDEE